MKSTLLIPPLALVLLVACSRQDVQARTGYQQARDTADKVRAAAKASGVSDSCDLFTTREISQLLGGQVGAPEEVGLMGNCRWTASDGRYVQTWVVDDPDAWSERDCRRKESLDIGQRACVGTGIDLGTHAAAALTDSGLVAVTAPTRDLAVELLRRAVERQPQP